MNIPLAEKLRPKTLNEVVGQEHVLLENGVIRRTISHKKPLSLLLWGPPGCGKTTLAKVYASELEANLFALSAVSTGVADIKKIIEDVISKPLIYQRPLLFIDEIHRYNKAQQDLFLPYVEKGILTLVGATTENPSFAINNALISRMHVLTLQPLNSAALEKLLLRCEAATRPLTLEPSARTLLIELAAGDGRTLLNMVEQLQLVKASEPLSAEQLQEIISKKAALYDKSGEQHYNLISALHKAVRGSDPDASLYWFMRMVHGGEELLFLARRLIRMASEDIGLADPQALTIAIAARDAYQMLGSPEGELALAEAVIYMALAPKSNAVYEAFNKASEAAAQTNHLPPPQIILNASTTLMKKQGYGSGYLYDHDQPHAFSGQNYFPDSMERQKFYFPVQRGFEREMQKRQSFFEELRQKKQP